MHCTGQLRTSMLLIHLSQFAGMKMLLHKQFGYGRLPRRPLLPSSEESAAAWFKNPLLLDILKEEEKYASSS